MKLLSVLFVLLASVVAGLTLYAASYSGSSQSSPLQGAVQVAEFPSRGIDILRPQDEKVRIGDYQVPFWSAAWGATYDPETHGMFLSPGQPGQYGVTVTGGVGKASTRNTRRSI